MPVYCAIKQTPSKNSVGEGTLRRRGYIGCPRSLHITTCLHQCQRQRTGSTIQKQKGELQAKTDMFIRRRKRGLCFRGASRESYAGSKKILRGPSSLTDSRTYGRFLPPSSREAAGTRAADNHYSSTARKGRKNGQVPRASLV